GRNYRTGTKFGAKQVGARASFGRLARFRGESWLKTRSTWESEGSTAHPADGDHVPPEPSRIGCASKIREVTDQCRFCRRISQRNSPLRTSSRQTPGAEERPSRFWELMSRVRRSRSISRTCAERRLTNACVAIWSCCVRSRAAIAPFWLHSAPTSSSSRTCSSRGVLL